MLHQPLIAQQQSFSYSSELFYFFIFIILFLWSRHRHNKFSLRMIKSRSYSQSNIDDEKIILAIQIKNLIFETSDKKMNGYEELEIQQSKEKGIFNKIKQMFGYGAYYKLMFQKNRIKSFFKALKQLQNVQIYLYTSLSKQFTQKILQKLQLSQYFPLVFRRYCQQQQQKTDLKKHPAWIDCNTRRVIIMTTNKQDYDQEDKKYFLVLNRIEKQRLLKDSLMVIRQIAEKVKVKCVDELHNEMDEIKAQIETENQMDNQGN